MKHSLFFALCLAMILGILATSAFGSVHFVPVSSLSDPIDGTGFRTPPMSNYVASAAVSVPRIPHYYEYGPAINATGFASPGSNSIDVTGFRTPPMSNYGPSAAVSAPQIPHYYEYGPAINATGFASPGSK